MGFKKRPVLLIAQADTDDYNIIPISRVTNRHNLDSVYDVMIDPAVYPNAGLAELSFARTHKQTTVHTGEIDGHISDLKSVYPDLYLYILEMREQYSAEITEQALE